MPWRQYSKTIERERGSPAAQFSEPIALLAGDMKAQHPTVELPASFKILDKEFNMQFHVHDLARDGSSAPGPN
jgi:hypothetical protein